MLSVTITNGVIPQRELLEDTSKKDSSRLDKCSYKLVQPNDIAYNKMRAWQGAVGVSGFRGIISPAYVVQRPRNGINSRYLHYLLRTPAFSKEAERWSYGITSDMWSLRPEHFKMIYSCVPPLPEQNAIVQYLEYVDERISRYINTKHRLIDLLEEQRHAVIQRAVTQGLDPNIRLKPSGVEWLGDVPAHWEIRRLKTICSMKSGDSITGMTIEPVGEYPVYGGNGIRGYTSDYTNDGNFVLIGRQGALCGNIHVVRGRFWASEHAVIASLHPYHDLDWFGFILTVMNLNQYSISAAQPGLAVERILNIALPVPSLRDQFAIAEYLHKTTADIDAAIDRARQEIELLKEYRTRLTADVVTGKLDVREAEFKLPEAPDGLRPSDKQELQSD